MKEIKKEKMEIKLAKGIKSLLDDEIMTLGSGAGTLFFYQPEEPEQMKKMRNAE
ncbi:MAG: hypothetical protein J5962_04935 [Lachnospiraceae bacterium]|nr:hypothetical protein [Lachnospiraceae bacterium]